ncbi:hypothetical protein CDD81_6859 [Ophiocordyceps australis]|uniref:Swiss Army Knife protein DSP-PTPase phosphatase domain-containing protein n=1 Tax=Ophiocordyceps australis TaxID=1399860 RepID=A0A2C5XZE6_9HYPO|nr:hypothetical protein CDD81_6859 [Ophiocordyceps australis]
MYPSAAQVVKSLFFLLLSCPVVFGAALVSQTPAWHQPSIQPLGLSKSPILSQKRVGIITRSLSDPATPDSPPGGFHRFEQVTDYLHPSDRLFRSSAPYYQRHDSDQRLTDDSIHFLQNKGINLVISLNQEAMNPEFVEKFRKSGIEYVPLPVEDFHAPTVQNFRQGYAAFKKHDSGTLVWCGYGHGRTGAMISALQVGRQSEMKSPRTLSRADFDRNHVEKADQRAVLERFQELRARQSRLAPPQDPSNALGSRRKGGGSAAGRGDRARTRNKEAAAASPATRKPGASANRDGSQDNGPARTRKQPLFPADNDVSEEPPVITEKMRGAGPRRGPGPSKASASRPGSNRPSKDNGAIEAGPPRKQRRPPKTSANSPPKHGTTPKSKTGFKTRPRPQRAPPSKRPPPATRMPKHNGPGRGNNHGGAIRVPKPPGAGGRPGGGVRGFNMRKGRIGF